MPIPCPKCGRPLDPSGEAVCDGETFPVYQCPECVTRTEIMGEPFDVALTFCLDSRGRPFDPASPPDRN